MFQLQISVVTRWYQFAYLSYRRKSKRKVVLCKILRARSTSIKKKFWHQAASYVTNAKTEEVKMLKVLPIFTSAHSVFWHGTSSGFLLNERAPSLFHIRKWRHTTYCKRCCRILLEAISVILVILIRQRYFFERSLTNKYLFDDKIWIDSSQYVAKLKISLNFAHIRKYTQEH